MVVHHSPLAITIIKRKMFPRHDVRRTEIPGWKNRRISGLYSSTFWNSLFAFGRLCILVSVKTSFVVFRQRGKFSIKNYELRLRNPTNPYQSHKKCCCCYLVDNPTQLRTHHSHGKTGNSGWKIKWFTLFRLESFRKYGLWFQGMQCC